MNLIGLFLALTLPIFARGISSQTPNTEVNSHVMSPYAFAELVNRNSGKHDPNLKLDLLQRWKQAGIEPGYFGSCGPECKAEIYSEELEGTPGNEVLLKLTNSTNFCRFLVFKSVGKRWKFLGHLDHDFNRYEMARHRVALFNGKPWLVIRSQAGSGSGYSLYFETWYEVGPNGLREILAYPVGGHTYPWPAGLGRDFEARTIGNEANSNGDLVIRYLVRYSKLDYRTNKDSEFLSNEHLVHFAWIKETKTLKFEPSRSTISQTEIFAIANIDDDEEEEETSGTPVGNMKFYSKNETKAFIGGGYEVFLKYNLSALLKIAGDKTNEHREWLRLFLNECDETDEKKALLLALEKA